eukprot:4764069-Alexandrium_andersonii.AAC.1
MTTRPTRANALHPEFTCLHAWANSLPAHEGARRPTFALPTRPPPTPRRSTAPRAFQAESKTRRPPRHATFLTLRAAG